MYMVLKEVQIKTISELPSHQKVILRELIGDDAFNRYSINNALVEIPISNSIPHMGEIETFGGSFSDRILTDVNNGEKIEDIFK